jgi:hypothetical protein
MTSEQRLKQRRTKKLARIFFTLSLAYCAVTAIHTSFFKENVESDMSFASVQVAETSADSLNADVVNLYVSLDFGETLNTVINAVLRAN